MQFHSPMAHVLFLGIILASCSPKQTTPSYSFQIKEENGVLVALTTGGPKYEGELFEYIPITKLQEDERDESIVGRPYTPITDETGNVYVPDGADNRIVVFNNSGRYERSIGRAGSGPGEFLFPEIQSVGDGQLEIFDRRQRRVTVYSTSGELLRVLSLPIKISRGVSGYHPAPDGRFVGIINETSLTGIREERWAQAIIFDTKGDSLRSVTTQKLPGGKIYSWRISERIMGRGPAPYGYQSYPHAFYSSHHGIILSSGRDPVLDIYDLDGSQKLQIRIDLPPQPVTNEDRESLLSEQRERIENSSENIRERLEEAYRNTEFADSKPYWGIIDVDDSGFFWLSIAPLPSEGEETISGWRFHILSPEGEYLGITTQPRSAGKVRYGLLPASDRDPETGQTTIEIYRVLPAVEGLKYLKD